MPRFRRLTPGQRQMLFELLLTKEIDRDGGPGHGLTDKQIAVRVGIAIRTLGYYKKAFIEENPSLERRMSGANKMEMKLQNLRETLDTPLDEEAANFSEAMEIAAEVKGVEKMMAPIKSILSIDQMLSVLSNLATGGPLQYRVQAVKLLDELQATHRPAETFGPPPPLTQDDCIDRLTRLILSQGETITLLAYEKAYGTDHKEATATISGSSPKVGPSGDQIGGSNG